MPSCTLLVLTSPWNEIRGHFMIYGMSYMPSAFNKGRDRGFGLRWDIQGHFQIFLYLFIRGELPQFPFFSDLFFKKKKIFIWVFSDRDKMQYECTFLFLSFAPLIQIRMWKEQYLNNSRVDNDFIIGRVVVWERCLNEVGDWMGEIIRGDIANDQWTV